MIFRLLAGIWIFCLLAWGHTQLSIGWREEAQRCVEARDWATALDIVDREIAHVPQDMDVRAWHARIRMWSGKLAEAEREYLEILAVVPNDPDNWMGLASVYSREGRTREALRALDRYTVAYQPAEAVPSIRQQRFFAAG